jgi:hypothetical protein
MYLLASIVMAILVIVLSGAWPTSLLLKIVLKFLFGGMIYILMLLLLREELARNLVKKLFLFKLSVNEMK